MFEFGLRTRVVFGPGCLATLGARARELGLSRVLLVADPGLREAGHVEAALHALHGVGAVPFHDFSANPDADHCAAAAALAVAERVDGFVALGGGSSLDCAKGANLLLAGGGSIADYRGHGRARGRLMPMIGVPTTAGTGSEAQSYALICDPTSHAKLACGDPGLAFRLALLDPELLRTQPRTVAASSGFDALAHAVETWVSTARTPFSELLSREAFRRLDAAFLRALDGEPAAQTEMLLGAHLAGAAIEASMLGAAHALANPLTARHGTVHGEALAVLLPHVVRFNAADRYAELLGVAGHRAGADPAGALAERLSCLAAAAGLPGSLARAGVTAPDLDVLAGDAASQWTGTFNPRPLDAAVARELYRCAA